MGFPALWGTHSQAAGGPAPREGIPGGGRLPARLGWGLQCQHPRAWPAKSRCSHRLHPGRQLMGWQ